MVWQRPTEEAHVGDIDQAILVVGCHHDVAQVQGAEVDPGAVQLTNEHGQCR
ncbi:hypothetical protein D3C75_1103870 [compost metagenome]